MQQPSLEIHSKFSSPTMMEPTHSQSGHANGTSTTNGNSSSSDSADEDQISIRFADWGFKIDRLFEVAYRFYKRNESKAFHPSFDERNKMIALVMQARYGNHDNGKAPDVGVLDFVGQRRQYEWSMLNGMSKTEAMSKFICALDSLCPLFKAHAEAVKISSGIVDGNQTSKFGVENTTDNKQPAKFELDPQMHNIYLSLCKQTYNQFKGYAEQQYPEDTSKQKYLITSLQEQYYQQYISQMHPEHKSSLPDSGNQTSNQSNSNIPSSLPSPAISDRSNSNSGSIMNNQSGDSSIISENQLPLVPTTPHLELPLPPKEINFPAPNELGNVTNGQAKPVDINESIYPSDTYCEENNVQADISSEELNSDSATNVATLVDDTVDGITVEGKLTEKMQSTSIKSMDCEENKPNIENIKESVRLFRHSDLPPIGVFESFPEPRPIKTSSQKSTPIDQINPNLPAAFSKPPAKSESSKIDKPEPQQTPTNLSETPNPVTTEIPLEPPTSSEHFAPNTNDYRPSSSLNDDAVLPKPETQEASPSVARVDESACKEAQTNEVDIKAPTHEETTQQQPRQQVPELWDYASDGGHSPQVSEPMPYSEPEPATIWSKREIAEFKESLDNDKQGGIYEVKEGTLVIFEVPTYPDGKYIYWEFATDHFDLGFGLEFVYEQQLAQPLAMNIYEDVDEDDIDDLIEEDWSSSTPPVGSQFDPESGRIVLQNSTNDMLEVRRKILAEKRRRQGNTISIVPTYRRDSHQEVFVGRHKYPGRGYYLLRFDNTYSVLRSKTLYFRICYFI